MKRKKINFDEIKTSLKRSEMREITAGCGSSGGGGSGSTYAECTYIYNECMAGNPYLIYGFEWHNYNNFCTHIHNCCAKQAGSSVHQC